MDDLTERFHGLDEMAAPDVWPDATTRVPTDPNKAPLGGRLAVIGIAAIIAVGAFGFLFLAFRPTLGTDQPVGGSQLPGDSVSATPSPTGTVEEVSVPTAEEIVAGQWPLGDALADLLGLARQEEFKGQCSYYVEVHESGSGYCLEPLVELMASEDRDVDLAAIGEALRGNRVTLEELERIRAAIAEDPGGAAIGTDQPVGWSNQYPNPPASGYWILFPDAPEPLGGGSDGAVKIVALTNLPDGTLFLANSDRGGMCCPAVEGGQMIIRASSSGCGKVSEADSPGATITITTDADIGRHVIGVPIGAQPPQQPDSVLAVLGARFENLTGDQVVERGGEKVLIASATYSLPEPLCF